MCYKSENNPTNYILKFHMAVSIALWIMTVNNEHINPFLNEYSSSRKELFFLAMMLESK